MTKYLYKYYPIEDYSLTNLEKEEICFNSMSCFNDLCEGVFTVKTRKPDLELAISASDMVGEAYSEQIRFRFRVLSLTTRYDKRYMWDEYAQHGAGFCIEYNYEDIKSNERIEKLGSHTCKLYEALSKIQKLFDIIRNVPADTKLKFEKLRSVSLNWKQQAEKIEADYNKAEVKAAGHGAAGIGAGVAVAALGPTAAMGIATTFGVASTGTAISALSGAAATNAALAWLGGGALAAGGGGMAAGNAFLALAGPVGWAIAGVSLVTSGVILIVTQMNKEKLENIFTLISERDVRSYKTAIVELNERIQRITDESKKLTDAIERIKAFGTDYNAMSESQQYELGSYVNLMEASTMLLINPILGLQPKFSEQDFEKLCSSVDKLSRIYYTSHKAMVISLANLLF